MARGLLVAVVALLVAAQVVRNAAVTALAAARPSEAARIWSGHPDVELSLAMTAIGKATREHKPVPPAAFAMIRDAAAKAPLAPEPFLVRGVQAQLAGDQDIARRAFEAAEWRDPRSLPARYFLADQALRSGDARRGLSEFAALARLAPNGITTVTPFVASYARDPANWPQMRAVFRADPYLTEATLIALAADPANARAILALAGPGHRDARSPWLQPLLNGLVDAGQYAEARTILGRCRPRAGPIAGAIVRFGLRERRGAAAVQLDVDLLDRRPGRAPAWRPAPRDLLRPGGRLAGQPIAAPRAGSIPSDDASLGGRNGGPELVADVHRERSALRLDRPRQGRIA